MTSIPTHSTTPAFNATVFTADDSVVKRYPSTESQLEIWLSSTQNEEASCAYNEITTLEISGDLDPAILRVAMEQLVERHESLRSFISPDGREVVVRKCPDFDFDLFDWTSDSLATAKATAREIVRSFACTPFDLCNGPLLRVAVQKLATEHYRVTFVAHHIVIDGWSLGVFVRDLGMIYDSLAGGPAFTLPAPPNYVDYSVKMDAYLRSDEGQADEAFWVKQFEKDIPVLDLPVTHKRSHLRSYTSGRHDHHLPPELVARIRKVGAKSGCSLFGAVFTAFQSYLARITGNNDFCIGIPTAGQPSMDMPDLLGHCVNTLPLRSTLDLNNSFNERLKKTRTEMLDAFDHQRYSYGTLLRKLSPPRDPSRPPMLAVSLNVDPVLDTTEMGFTGMDVEIAIEPREYENFEWFVNGVIHPQGSIELQIQYNSDLFSQQAIEFYFEGFEGFLEQLVDQPDASLDSHSMMTIGQRQTVACKWNETDTDVNTVQTLQAEFAKTAQQSPNATAVRFHDDSLSYQQADEYSNQLANYLVSEGVQPGDLVGLCVDRSMEMFTAVLAILKAGAGYVPLDPNYPVTRLAYMCDHADVKLVVSQSQHQDLLKEFGRPCVAIDTQADAIANCESTSPGVNGKGTDTAYVIFTSGSTGKPKGVLVSHCTVLNLLHSMLVEPGLASDESILAVTSLSFDMSVSEIFLPMTCGACLAIADKETTIDGEKLAAAIEKYDATLVQATPVTFRLLSDSTWKGKNDLRIVSAGEPFPSDLVRPLLDKTGEVWNMYGPTETTVYSTIKQITDADAPILIGKPIANTQIRILDPYGHETPPGVEGEMFIGGAGVTNGYLDREDLTKERFVNNPWFNPFTNYGSHHLYRTGDVARYTFDGEIEYLRRNDKQVKIRGFRIELGEIERSIRGYRDSITQVIAIVREESNGNPVVVAYWTGEHNDQFSAADLREHLRGQLPHYMIPKHFIHMDEFPQTSNGKVDHKSLPDPGVQVQFAGDIIPPTTEAECLLAAVWEQTLEVDGISLDDNFFELGGHSLLVMQVIAEIEKKTTVRLGPQDFLVGTLENLAHQIDRKTGDQDVSLEPPADVSTNVVESSEVEQTSQTATASDSEETPPKQSRFASLIGFWDKEENS